jgi:hypothetical protein
MLMLVLLLVLVLMPMHIQMRTIPPRTSRALQTPSDDRYMPIDARYVVVFQGGTAAKACYSVWKRCSLV